MSFSLFFFFHFFFLISTFYHYHYRFALSDLMISCNVCVTCLLCVYVCACLTIHALYKKINANLFHNRRIVSLSFQSFLFLECFFRRYIHVKSIIFDVVRLRRRPMVAHYIRTRSIFDFIYRTCP